jgi:hypothetical protein
MAPVHHPNVPQRVFRRPVAQAAFDPEMPLGTDADCRRCRWAPSVVPCHQPRLCSLIVLVNRGWIGRCNQMGGALKTRRQPVPTAQGGDGPGRFPEHGGTVREAVEGQGFGFLHRYPDSLR